LLGRNLWKRLLGNSLERKRELEGEISWES